MAETTTTSTEDNDHIIKEEMTISFEEQEYHIIWQTEAVGVNGDEKEDTLLYHSLREVEYGEWTYILNIDDLSRCQAIYSKYY